MTLVRRSGRVWWKQEQGTGNREQGTGNSVSESLPQAISHEPSHDDLPACKSHGGENNRIHMENWTAEESRGDEESSRGRESGGELGKLRERERGRELEVVRKEEFEEVRESDG